MWLLYQLLFAAALLLAGPVLLLRRGRHYLETLRGRLGGYDGPASEGALWLHAVSVGEVGVAATLVRALPGAPQILVTTITPTGQKRAREALAGRAAVAYLPFDLGFAVRRFLRRFEPRALILVEGDLWPLVLRRFKQRGAPVMVINGKIGDRSFRRLRVLRPLARRLLEPVDRFAVQTEADRDRLVALGVPGERIVRTGNLKFDSPEPAIHAELESWLRELAAERPILMAGSTMPGEERLVLAAYRRLGGGRRALLVLAPRHPERWPEVASMLAADGLPWARRSAFPTSAGADVVLLDSLGELSGLYRIAAAAFIGGTLVATGGHNPLEAARFGVPTLVGPSMENFREIAAQFDAAGAWGRVADPATLAESWDRWLREPAEAHRVGRRGAAVVEANRGALARTLETIAPLLQLVASVP